MSENIKRLINQGEQFLKVASAGMSEYITDTMLTSESFASEYDLLYEVFGYNPEELKDSSEVEGMVDDISSNLKEMLPIWKELLSDVQ